MRKVLSYLSGFLVLVSCKNDKKNAEQTFDYIIAYNIQVPERGPENWDVFTVGMDGKNRKNITKNKDIAWVYYAYEDQIYFISDRDTSSRCFFLYRTDAKGTRPEKVTELRMEDSWMSSRNGGREMIVSARVGDAIRYQLFLVDLQSGKYKQLTSDTTAKYTDPCFSPDGKSIVCCYKKNRRDTTSFSELFVMDENGSGLRQLTHYPVNNVSYKDRGYKAGAPRWHPTENFISYISKQDGKLGIFAVSADGKKQWKISASKAGEGWHDWSPDGNWLVYDAVETRGDETQSHIMLKNQKTGELRKLTDDHFRSQMAPVFVKKR